MMSPLLHRLGILPLLLLGKNSLPPPFSRRIRIFAIHRIMHFDSTPARGKVFVMDRLAFHQWQLVASVRRL